MVRYYKVTKQYKKSPSRKVTNKQYSIKFQPNCNRNRKKAQYFSYILKDLVDYGIKYFRKKKN